MHVLPPENLRLKLDELYYQAYIHQRTWRWSKAVTTYRTMYETLVENQPRGSRFHKGAPLHLLGIALLHVQNTAGALESFLLAYTEDTLSKSPGEEERADRQPAGVVLGLYFVVRPALLEVIKKLARGAKEAKQVIQDPSAILTKALAEMGIDEQQIDELCGAIPEIEPKRSLDKLDIPWERRVFVGGNYLHITDLERIKKAVAQAGYDPILAEDFEMPEDFIHHHTLMLLHSCRLAVFDITQGNGHLMEIERASDYDISPLFVYKAVGRGTEPYVSTMLKTRLKQSGYEPQPYRHDDELEELIRKYLEGKGPSSGEEGFPLAAPTATEATPSTISEISRKETTSLLPWAEEANNEA